MERYIQKKKKKKILKYLTEEYLKMERYIHQLTKKKYLNT